MDLSISMECWHVVALIVRWPSILDDAQMEVS